MQALQIFHENVDEDSCSVCSHCKEQNKGGRPKKAKKKKNKKKEERRDLYKLMQALQTQTVLSFNPRYVLHLRGHSSHIEFWVVWG